MKLNKICVYASLFFFVLCQPLSLLAEIEPALKTELSSELDYIGTLYQNYYAPKSWKEKHISWNLNQELETAKQGIQKAQSVSEYREAVLGFFNSMQDYHVSARFRGTELATLPLTFKTFQNKTLIVEINTKKLSETSFPFKVGDEIVAMDGIPTSEIRANLIKNMKTTAPLTDLAIGDLMLAKRAARNNQVVPDTTVTLTILKAGETNPRTHQLNWEYTPEEIPGIEKLPSHNAFNNNVIIGGNLKTTQLKLFERANSSLLSPILIDFAENASVDDSLYGLGSRKSFLPDLGPRIWETDANNTFDAYIYQNEKNQLIGVIRIASYVPNDADQKGLDKAVTDFAEILKKMQKSTSALIINQLNNPGGSVFYLYALASMLTDQAFYTPKHRMGISSENVQECLAANKSIAAVTSDEEAKKILGDTIAGYPVSYEVAVAVRNYCRFVINQFKQGKSFSDPFYIFGVDKINPSAVVQYVKPIMILVNELDFSGGDFFPAIMQDNKRVTIIGTRTAGAGGYVNKMTVPNQIGLEFFTLTGSIAERIDNNPIENLGVTPDISLEMTVDDVRNSYKHYTDEVKKYLADKIK